MESLDLICSQAGNWNWRFPFVLSRESHSYCYESLRIYSIAWNLILRLISANEVFKLNCKDDHYFSRLVSINEIIQQVQGIKQVILFPFFFVFIAGVCSEGLLIDVVAIQMFIAYS